MTSGSRTKWSSTRGWSPLLEQLRFSVNNEMGEVSNMLWSVFLSNPEMDGLMKLRNAGALRVQPK